MRSARLFLLISLIVSAGLLVIALFAEPENQPPVAHMVIGGMAPTSPDPGPLYIGHWVIYGGTARAFWWAIRADLDYDGDVDGVDYMTFSSCYAGSNNPPAAGCQSILADLDQDGDVDGFDYMTFNNCFNGSGNRPKCQ